MNCIDAQSDEECYQGKDTYIWNSGCCHYVVNGKAIFIMNKKEKERQSVGCYDLSTGRYQEVAKENPEYFLPYYVQSHPYEEWFMDYSCMNILPEEIAELFGG